jgi:uncharacterized Zn finger protein
MACPKCEGFLSKDAVYTDQGKVDVLRCICCGVVIDALILSNRDKRYKKAPR